MEYVGRYEENAFLLRMMKLVGHKETVLYEFGGYGHNIRGPAIPLVFNHIKLIKEKIKKTKTKF